MKRYRVTKIIYAKNLAEAYRKEINTEPIEVSLDEDVRPKTKPRKIGYDTSPRRK